MRPLQKQLAGRIGVDWSEFALISPDIWRKQLLDYAASATPTSTRGAFTGEELAIIDQKLDRYMARKAERGEMSHLLIDRFRFDSFAPDSDEAGSNLLTRFGQIVYLFFLVTPPDALVERAWNRGLDVGRYKAVDDTLAHARRGVRRACRELSSRGCSATDKRVHFEFLDNTRDARRAAAHRRVRLERHAQHPRREVPARHRAIPPHRRGRAGRRVAYRDPADLDVARNADFLRRCLTGIREVNFADQDTGRIYLRFTRGAIDASTHLRMVRRKSSTRCCPERPS